MQGQTRGEKNNPTNNQTTVKQNNNDYTLSQLAHTAASWLKFGFALSRQIVEEMTNKQE
jgi:hypothetical protein